MPNRTSRHLTLHRVYKYTGEEEIIERVYKQDSCVAKSNFHRIIETYHWKSPFSFFFSFIVINVEIAARKYQRAACYKSALSLSLSFQSGRL